MVKVHPQGLGEMDAAEGHLVSGHSVPGLVLIHSKKDLDLNQRASPTGVGRDRRGRRATLVQVKIFLPMLIFIKVHPQGLQEMDSVEGHSVSGLVLIHRKNDLDLNQRASRTGVGRDGRGRGTGAFSLCEY